MQQPFNNEEIEFIHRIGGQSAGKKWINILQKLSDYLSDVRTAPMPSNGDMAQFGSVMMARRTAGKVIEEMLIDQLKAGQQKIDNEITSYR